MTRISVSAARAPISSRLRAAPSAAHSPAKPAPSTRMRAIAPSDLLAEGACPRRRAQIKWEGREPLRDASRARPRYLGLLAGDELQQHRHALLGLLDAA